MVGEGNLVFHSNEPQWGTSAKAWILIFTLLNHTSNCHSSLGPIATIRSFNTSCSAAIIFNHQSIAHHLDSIAIMCHLLLCHLSVCHGGFHCRYSVSNLQGELHLPSVTAFSVGSSAFVGIQTKQMKEMYRNVRNCLLTSVFHHLRSWVFFKLSHQWCPGAAANLQDMLCLLLGDSTAKSSHSKLICGQNVPENVHS